ncbi:MAG: sulfotransferase [Desulfobacterales bacterium]|jgi:tetratricopeptide (TPR) repeat protein
MADMKDSDRKNIYRKIEEFDYPVCRKAPSSKGPVLINSLPKSGTNLLAKVLQLFPGLSKETLHLGYSDIYKFEQNPDSKNNLVRIGVDFPTVASIDSIEDQLISMPDNTFATAHLPFSSVLARFLQKSGFKMILILRDPRDVVVSHAKYIHSSPAHPLHKHYQTLNFDEQIMTSIQGFEQDLKMPDINQRVQSLLQWAEQSFTYTTYFEKLVGREGGGSKKVQIDEVNHIGQHLNIYFTESQLDTITNEIFGGTATFSRGKIGAWHEAFNEEHKEAFHRRAGRLLVELGYEKNQNWKDSPKIKWKHKVDQVKKEYFGDNLIFLISQPRAGSTLLQRILGGHPEIHTTAEPWIMLHPLYALKKNGLVAEYDSNLAGQGLEDFLMQIPEGTGLYIRALRQMASVLYDRMTELSGRTFFLDKTPRYYYIIPELYQVFPKAKFIFLLRNPMAVMSSTLSTWFENRPQNLKKSLNYHDLTKGPHYLVEGIKILGKDGIIVHYEELVKNSNQIINDLCDRIGIPFNEHMLAYGKHRVPRGRFGDANTIHRHSKPVLDYVDKWVENLAGPGLIDFANEYLALLGADLITKMGYSYREIENKINSAIPLNDPQKDSFESTDPADRWTGAIQEIVDINTPFGLSKTKKAAPSRRKIKVSAIVSTYNSERFIRGCLQDLVDQTLFQKGEVEVIVIDSGSQQAEGAIVREFQHKFLNIRYIRTEQHETVYAAWNRGIKIASGTYITNANTDDRHRRDAFEQMVKVLEMKPDVALVYADVLKTEIENETFERCTAVDAYHWYDWDRNILLKEGCFIGPQPMWRRSVHDDYGYFDASLISSGDYEFWLRISQSYDFFHIRMPLGLYLIRPDSIEHAEKDTKRREDSEIRFMYAKAVKEKKLIKTNQGGNDVENYEKMYQGIQPLLKSSNREDAIATLKNLVESFPDFAQAHNDLGVLLYKHGEKEPALKHYEQAVRLDAGNCTFKKNLADFYYVEQGRIEDALNLYVDVLAMNPQDVESLLIIGHICVGLQRFDDAKVFYNRILEIEPGNPDVLQLLEKIQNPGQTQNTAKTPEEMYQQIQPLMTDNDPQAVIGLLKDLLASFPNFALAHNDLGVLHYNVGDKENALTHYEQAAQLEPDNITFKKNLADFYFVEQNRVEDALKLYVDVLAMQPEDAETLLITGHICVSLQKFDDAKVFYNRVLEIEPWNADARQNLEILESKREAV